MNFNLAFPFHLQIKFWKAAGLRVDARLLATNIIKVSQTYLEPLYDYLQELIRKESVIHMYETPFQVIDQPNETGYFLLTRSPQQFSKHQIIIFHYYNPPARKTIAPLFRHPFLGLLLFAAFRCFLVRLYP
ncbi:IS66 family transposase, partial [Limosilactobacillus reuteri]|uniref:IS66 family transposase n=1 Tax=Limosilactobacillus reuteri TaxID=1598 RepID=UPI0021E88B22